MVADESVANPLDPPWRRWPKFQFPGDAVVHRVVAVRGLGQQIHDEVMITVTAYTGCGQEIGTRVLTNYLEAAGFRHARAMLTCLFCASEHSGDGDKMAADVKLQILGFLYGADSIQLLRRFPRAPSARLMIAYAYDDAAAMLSLVRITRSRMRPFSREFRRRLARRLLP